MTDQTTPAPPLPTLADMPGEERRACQWMQADVANLNTRYVILEPRDPNGSAVMMAQSGRVVWFRPHRVTPRPDLPRMTWPNLPEANDPNMLHPTTKGWLLDAQDRPVVWTAPGCSVMIQRIEPGDLTPDQARTFALNVLAAAAYSEGTTHE